MPAGVWIKAFAYEIKPSAVASSRSRFSGLLCSRLSYIFNAKGRASFTSSGSPSLLNTEVPWGEATASATIDVAILLMEQEERTATPSKIRGKTCGKTRCRALLSDFIPAYLFKRIYNLKVNPTPTKEPCTSAGFVKISVPLEVLYRISSNKPKYAL